MNDEIIGRYTGTAAGDEAEEISTAGGYKPVGFYPTTRHAIWLELRMKTGDSEALRYAFIHRISFNPSKGIVIYHTDGQVTIEGHGLRELHSLLLRDRAIYVQEYGIEAGDQPGHGETCVTKITTDQLR